MKGRPPELFVICGGEREASNEMGFREYVLKTDKPIFMRDRRVFLVKSHYASNDNTAVRVLEADTGLPFAILTVNGPYLPPGEIYINDYERNKGESPIKREGVLLF